MANAVIARDQGGDYQARFFWLHACRLFQRHTKVARVAYEFNKIKSFDDVVVSYTEPLSSERGDSVTADYFQVKFHGSQAGAFTYRALTDPKFINATKVSLLQKVHEAQKSFVPDGNGCRLIIVSPWVIHPDDQLAELVSNNGGEIRLQTLFDDKGPTSKMGKVRALWRQHLELKSDDELATVLRPLRIQKDAPTLTAIDELLNLHLSLSGFIPVEAGQLVHPYDDLIRKLLAQGSNEFTREQLQEIGVRERLWCGLSSPGEEVGQIGVRSFMRWAEHMEDETEDMLDLVTYFDNRNVREQYLWGNTIFPEVKNFLSRYEQASRRYHLLLDTHSSVAFAAGYCLEAKAGANVVPVQRTRAGREVWHAQPNTASQTYAGWSQLEDECESDGDDVAIAISITHDIMNDVKDFIIENVPQVHRIINCAIESGPSPSAILNGTHAFLLAQKLATTIKRRSRKERFGVLHIFVAAPNAFVFFLGQMACSFGRCLIYEYDFDSNEPGAYQPSIAFPPTLSTMT